MLANFAIWLNATALSEYLRRISWLVPLSQTVHIVAIAALLAAFLFLTARYFNLIAPSEKMSQMRDRYMPWAWSAFGVLILTGLVQVIAEPERSLPNPYFQIKMVAFVFVVAIGFAIEHAIAARTSESGETTAAPATRSRALGVELVTGLCLLFFIVFCGRWIAYSVFS